MPVLTRLSSTASTLIRILAKLFHTNRKPTLTTTLSSPTTMTKGRAQAFLDATVIRRSVVQIKAETVIPEERIVDIVQHAILHAPSPFHVQSCRAIVLFNDEHRKLWDIAKETVMTTMPPPVFASLEHKLKEYRGGYGTVSRLCFLV